MKKVALKKVSPKRKAELEEYYPLEEKLRLLCGNKSELSGAYADWQTHWDVEGHHITGRNGKRLLNPWNIIMITRVEHDTIWKYSKEELLQIVKGLRIKQGFEEVENGKEKRTIS